MRRMTYGGIDHSDAGWDKASLLLLAVLAVLVLLTFDQYGEGFDALVQDVYGQDVLRWYATLGHDRSALSYIDLYYYGGLFDGLAALANLVSPFGHWATRHLLEALFGLLGLVAVWRTARRLGGPLAGFLSLAALALMPSWYGMMFINPKDIPFAAMMAAALYAGTCILDAVPRPGWRRVVGFGACAGLALGVRVAGVLCFLYLALALLLAAWRLESARHARFRLALRFGLRILLPSFALAWTLMLICWPWAQTSPILHPWEALTHFAGIHSHIRTLFFGEEVGRQGVSALYLPVYLAIKLPEVVLVMLAAGLAALAGRLWRKVMPVPSPALLLVLLAAWFPLAYAMATAPQLYDAERHFLFVLPPLAILAGLGCARLLHETGGRPRLAVALGGLLLVSATWQIVAMARLHPYEYAYFNALVGGTRGARGQFETEYWGVSLAEATTGLRDWLDRHQPRHGRPWRVGICGNVAQFGDRAAGWLRPAADWRKADFFIATTRGGCDRFVAGRTIVTVARDGVPFAVVKRVGGAAARAGAASGRAVLKP